MTTELEPIYYRIYDSFGTVMAHGTMLVDPEEKKTFFKETVRIPVYIPLMNRNLPWSILMSPSPIPGA